MKNLKALIITTVALHASAAFAQNEVSAPVSAGATVAAPVTLNAPAGGTNTPGIDNTAARQQQRIDQGVQSGQLTNKEATHLEHQQQTTAKVEEKAKSDGIVTKKESKKIKHRQKKSSKHIAKKKHNKKTAQ